MISRVRNGWFGGDALHYLAQRGAIGPPNETLWEPSAGHLQAAVMIEYRLLYEMFGMGSYLPYVLPVVLMHLALCAVLYGLWVRLGAHRWAAAAGGLVLLFFGAGGEMYLADSMVAHSAAVLLAAAAVLVLHRGELSGRALAGAAVLVALAFTFSVAAIAVAVFVAAFALQRGGWRPALIVGAVPLLLFAIWFVLVGRDGGRVATDGGLLWDVPARALSLLYAPMSAVLGSPEGGALLTLVVVVAPLLARSAPTPLRDLALAGLPAAVTQCLMSALVSLEVGRDYVFGGRYQYLVLFFLLPSLVIAMGALFKAFALSARSLHPAVAPVLALVAAGLVIGNGLGDQEEAWRFTYEDQAVKARAWMTGGVAAAALGERMLDEDAGGYTAHAHDVVAFAEAGAAQWPTMKASAEDRLEAESVYFTAVGPESYGLPGPAELESSSFDKSLKVGMECKQLTAVESRPTLTFTSFDGAQIAVDSPHGSMSVVLERDGVVSDPRQYTITPGSPAFVATTAQLARVRVSFDAGGEFTVCSAGRP